MRRAASSALAATLRNSSGNTQTVSSASTSAAAGVVVASLAQSLRGGASYSSSLEAQKIREKLRKKEEAAAKKLQREAQKRARGSKSVGATAATVDAIAEANLARKRVAAAAAATAAGGATKPSNGSGPKLSPQQAFNLARRSVAVASPLRAASAPPKIAATGASSSPPSAAAHPALHPSEQFTPRRNVYRNTLNDNTSSSSSGNATMTNNAASPTQTVPAGQSMFRSRSAAEAGRALASKADPTDTVAQFAPNHLEDVLVLSISATRRTSATALEIVVEGTSLIAGGASNNSPWYKSSTLTIPLTPQPKQQQQSGGASGGNTATYYSPIVVSSASSLASLEAGGVAPVLPEGMAMTAPLSGATNDSASFPSKDVALVTQMIRDLIREDILGPFSQAHALLKVLLVCPILHGATLSAIINALDGHKIAADAQKSSKATALGTAPAVASPPRSNGANAALTPLLPPFLQTQQLFHEWFLTALGVTNTNTLAPIADAAIKSKRGPIAAFLPPPTSSPVTSTSHQLPHIIHITPKDLVAACMPPKFMVNDYFTPSATATAAAAAPSSSSSSTTPMGLLLELRKMAKVFGQPTGASILFVKALRDAKVVRKPANSPSAAAAASNSSLFASLCTPKWFFYAANRALLSQRKLIEDAHRRRLMDAAAALNSRHHAANTATANSNGAKAAAAPTTRLASITSPSPAVGAPQPPAAPSPTTMSAFGISHTAVKYLSAIYGNDRKEAVDAGGVAPSSSSSAAATPATSSSSSSYPLYDASFALRDRLLPKKTADTSWTDQRCTYVITAPIPLLRQPHEGSGDASSSSPPVVEMLSAAEDELTAGGYGKAAMEAVKQRMRAFVDLRQKQKEEESKKIKTTVVVEVGRRGEKDTNKDGGGEDAVALTTNAQHAAAQQLVAPLLLPGMKLPSTFMQRKPMSVKEIAAADETPITIVTNPAAAESSPSSSSSPLPIIVAANLKHFVRSLRHSITNASNSADSTSPSSSSSSSLDGIALFQAFLAHGGLVWCLETSQYYMSGLNVTDTKFTLSSSSAEAYLTAEDVAEANKGTKAATAMSGGAMKGVTAQHAAIAARISASISTPASMAAGRRKDREDGTRRATYALVGRLSAAHQASPWLSAAERKVLGDVADTFGTDQQQQQQQSTSFAAKKKTDASAPSGALVDITEALYTSQLQVAAHTNQLQSILYRSVCLVATEEMEHRGLAVAVSTPEGGGTAANAHQQSASASSITAAVKRAAKGGVKSTPAESPPSSPSATMPTLNEVHEGVMKESAGYLQLATKGLLMGYQQQHEQRQRQRGFDADVHSQLLLQRQQDTVVASFNINSTQHVTVALYGGCVPIMTTSYNASMMMGGAGASAAPNANMWGSSSPHSLIGGGFKTPLLLPQPNLHNMHAIASLIAMRGGGGSDPSVLLSRDEFKAAVEPYTRQFSMQYLTGGNTNSGAGKKPAAAVATTDDFVDDAFNAYLSAAKKTAVVNSGRRKSSDASTPSSASSSTPLVSIIRISAALSNSPKYPGFVTSLRVTRNDATTSANASSASSSSSSISPPSILYATNICSEGVANSGEKPLATILSEISSFTAHRCAAASGSKVLPFIDAAKMSAAAGHSGGSGMFHSTPIVIISVDGDTKTEMALHQSGIIAAISQRCAEEWSMLSNSKKKALGFDYSTGSAAAAVTSPSPSFLVVTESLLFDGQDDASAAKKSAAAAPTAAANAPSQQKKPAAAALTFNFAAMSSFEGRGGMGGGQGQQQVGMAGAVPKAVWAAAPLADQLRKRLGVTSYPQLLEHLAQRIGNVSNSAIRSGNASLSSARMAASSAASASSPTAHLPDPFLTSCPTLAHMQPSSQRTGSFVGLIAQLPAASRALIDDKRQQAETAPNAVGGGGGGFNSNSAAAGSANSSKGATDEMITVVVNEMTRHYDALSKRAATWSSKLKGKGATAVQRRQSSSAGVVGSADEDVGAMFTNLDAVVIDGEGASAADNSSASSSSEGGAAGDHSNAKETDPLFFDDEAFAKLLESEESCTAAAAAAASAAEGASAGASAPLSQSSDNTHRREWVITEASVRRVEGRLAELRSAIIGLKALQAYRGTEKIRAWVAPQTGQMARFLVVEPTNTAAATAAAAPLIPADVGVAAKKGRKNSLKSSALVSQHQQQQLISANMPVLRPSFIHTGTATGRLLCRDPNLQNIPKGSTAAADFEQIMPSTPSSAADDDESVVAMRDDNEDREEEAAEKTKKKASEAEGFSIRKLLSSRFVDAAMSSPSTTTQPRATGTLVEIDYSQLEPVAAAAITRDPALVEEIQNGVDQHCKRVAMFLHKTYEEVYRLCKVERVPEYLDHRQKMKVFSFQRQFGAGPKTISNTTGLSVPVIQSLIEDEKRVYAGVEAFHKLVEECASPAASRAIEAIRSRWMGHEKAAFIRSIESTNNNGVFPLVCGTKFGFNKGAGTTRIKNHPTQGFATELVQTAVGMVYMHLLRSGMLDDVVMVNTVHDSIWLDCKATLEELKGGAPRSNSVAEGEKPKSIQQVLADIETILVAVLPIYQTTFDNATATGGADAVTHVALAPVGLKVESAAGNDLSAMQPIRF